MAAVSASTIGYCIEIGSPHVRHRPRRTSQARTGTFSYQASSRPQRAQAEAGQTIDRPRGQAIDADVEEAADDSPEQGGYRGHGRHASVTRRAASAAWARPAGGTAVRTSRATRGRARRSRTACPRDPPGFRASAPARTSASQSDGGVPRLRREPIRALLERIDVVEGLELQQPLLRVTAEPVHFGGLANGLPHDPGRCGGRRLRARVVAASERSHHGAPGDLAGPFEPLGGGRIVLAPPVVHESGVEHVLPFIGSGL